ncbi:MAG: carotenoid biosynthesis protein [Thermodesulfobacteriota bacterium]|nr:carotenoid biosynthesis protein [Thermodesulfobacteriota bacterium]
MKAHNLIILILIPLYCLLWIGGIISYTFFDGPSSDSRWTAPLFLCLAAAISLTLTHPNYRLHLLSSGLMCLAVEMVGVHSGFPFGEYVYTQVLQPHFLGVPIAIGCAWLILFAYVKQMLQFFAIPLPWQYLCGASWMVTLDLVIDPLASGPLTYWIWEEKGLYYGIPLTNFLGWFIVSLMLFLIYRNPWPRHIGDTHVGLSIVIFFSLIAITRGILGAFVVGAGLVFLHFWVFWKIRIKDSGL